MQDQARERQRGVTLIELLVVVSLSALVLALGVPAMGAVLDSMRLATASQDMMSSLSLARNEAVKRNSRVALCKASLGEQCAKTGSWEQGWLVFHDRNNNALRDADEAILHRQAAAPGMVRLTGNAQVEHYISYTPAGNASLISGAFQAGTLTVCITGATPVKGRQLVLSSSGRVRSVRAELASCG